MVMFSERRPVAESPEQQPQLLVVVDTEEEFDWHAGPRRENTSVQAMAALDRVQTIFNEYGIRPCYVVDYPVASQADGYRLLKQYFLAGQCDIGAHLHPWVNPPFDEALTTVNMYPGNLSPDLERAKLQTLRDTIRRTFGVQPHVYKAGRYGFGPHTETILRDLGFDIDLSACPPVDYRADGGPDYREFGAHPFWFGSDRLLEIPVTGAFVGWAGPVSRPLYELAQRLKRWHAPGVLSRLSAVDRLMLSPEGFTHKEHRDITESLMARGVRTFTWSFHSPSVMPGKTPYVRTEQELNDFLDGFRRYFDYFFDELGGEATTPTQLKHRMEAQQ